MVALQTPHRAGLARCTFSRSIIPILTTRTETKQKNPKLRTIVNKLNTIHAQYRYFDMEVLAGEPDFIATLVCSLPLPPHLPDFPFHLPSGELHYRTKD